MRALAQIISIRRLPQKRSLTAHRIQSDERFGCGETLELKGLRHTGRHSLPCVGGWRRLEPRPFCVTDVEPYSGLYNLSRSGARASVASTGLLYFRYHFPQTYGSSRAGHRPSMLFNCLPGGDRAKKAAARTAAMKLKTGYVSVQLRRHVHSEVEEFRAHSLSRVRIAGVDQIESVFTFLKVGLGRYLEDAVPEVFGS